MNVSSLVLKIIVCVHFILSVWSCISAFMPQSYFDFYIGWGSMAFMPPSYIYLHTGVLLCGLWTIGAPESAEAVVMMLVTLGFSILQDIILLALYEPRGYITYEIGHEKGLASQSQLNEYRFALGMSILNLILKPFSAFLLFRVYQSRSDQTAFSVPGIDRIPGLGDMTRGGYEDLDTNRPPAPYTHVPVETASHHATVTKE